LPVWACSLSVAVGVGEFERNNKQVGVAKAEVRSLDENGDWGFVIFDINQSPQSSIVALKKLKWVDSVGNRTLSPWRGPAAAQHDSLNMPRR